MGLRLKTNFKHKTILPFSVYQPQGSYAETIPLMSMRKGINLDPANSQARIHDCGSQMDRNALRQSGMTCNISGRIDFRHVTVFRIFYCLGSKFSTFSVVIVIPSHLHIALCYICHIDIKSSVLKFIPGAKCLNIFIVSLFRSSLSTRCKVLLG